MSSPRAQRDAALIRLRSMNTGMVFAGVAAIGVASAAVAVATPGHATARPAIEQSNNSNVQQAPQQVNPDTNPPVVTSGGS
jgi:hypothetical protein